MSGLEVNKIIASVIVAILVVIIIGYAANIVMNLGSDEKKEVAYKIELPESNLSESIATVQIGSKIEPISALLMNASIDKGEKIYKKIPCIPSDTQPNTAKILLRKDILQSMKYMPELTCVW